MKHTFEIGDLVRAHNYKYGFMCMTGTIPGLVGKITGKDIDSGAKIEYTTVSSEGYSSVNTEEELELLQEEPGFGLNITDDISPKDFNRRF